MLRAGEAKALALRSEGSELGVSPDSIHALASHAVGRYVSLIVSKRLEMGFLGLMVNVYLML